MKLLKTYVISTLIILLSQLAAFSSSPIEDLDLTNLVANPESIFSTRVSAVKFKSTKLTNLIKIKLTAITDELNNYASNEFIIDQTSLENLAIGESLSLVTNKLSKESNSSLGELNQVLFSSLITTKTIRKVINETTEQYLVEFFTTEAEPDISVGEITLINKSENHYTLGFTASISQFKIGPANLIVNMEAGEIVRLVKVTVVDPGKRESIELDQAKTISGTIEFDL